MTPNTPLHRGSDCTALVRCPATKRRAPERADGFQIGDVAPLTASASMLLQAASSDVDLQHELGISNEQAEAIVAVLREPNRTSSLFIDVMYGMLLAELVAIGRLR